MIDAETLASIPAECRGCERLISRIEEDVVLELDPRTASIKYAEKLCRGLKEDGSCGHAGVAIEGIVGAIGADMFSELRGKEQ